MYTGTGTGTGTLALRRRLTARNCCDAVWQIPHAGVHA